MRARLCSHITKVMRRPGAFLTFALGDVFFPVRHGFKPDLKGSNCHASGEKMTFRLSRYFPLLAGLLLLTSNWPSEARELSPLSVLVTSPSTYTLGFLGTGNTLTLTDTLPLGVSAPGSFKLAGTSVTPTCGSQHRLMWNDDFTRPMVKPHGGTKEPIPATLSVVGLIHQLCTLLN